MVEILSNRKSAVKRSNESLEASQIRQLINQIHLFKAEEFRCISLPFFIFKYRKNIFYAVLVISQL